MNIETLVLGALETNCYLVYDDKNRQAMVIDPADDGSFISEKILELQLDLQAIVLTHGHFDHVLGLLELELNFNVPVYMHEADLFLIKQAQSSAHHWLRRQVDPVPLPTATLSEGQKLEIGTLNFEIIETPGHTPGSVSLYSPESNLLFSGDTLFKAAVGRTDFRYSDPQQLRASLDRLFELPEETIVYPGHGKVTTIEEEKNSR
ncbi:MAG TPA: MBL fold metallo-hydrolase [Patescibacteria group bacterium]